MIKLLNHLLNGAVVAGLIAATAFALPTPTAVYHNGWACVRPFYTITVVMKNNHPTIVREFFAYLPCHETYETDENGFMTFPEA